MKTFFVRTVVPVLCALLSVACSKEEPDGAGMWPVRDPALHRLLLELFDFDGDGRFSTEEQLQVVRLRCSPRGITSLEGIGYFYNLEGLYCERNEIASLQFVSEEKSNQRPFFGILSVLEVFDNPLDSVLLSGLSALRSVEFCGPQEAGPDKSSSIKIEHCERLERLSVRSFPSATLELIGCPGLHSLHLSSVRLPELDLSSLSSSIRPGRLSELSCDSCGLSSLDLEWQTALRSLSCRYNRLRELDASQSEILTELDCRFNPELKILYLSRKQRWIEDIRKDAHTEIRYVEDEIDESEY